MSELSVGGRVVQRLQRLVKANRVLRMAAGWLSRRVATSPESSALRKVLGPARDRLRGTMSVKNVHHIVEILSAHGIPFYIAGGWGVDALAGRQTRSHDDLDVVVDDYETHIQKALDAFEVDGFSILSDYTRRAWMPRSLTMTNAARVRMDLVSLNWRILAEAFGPDGASAEDRASFENSVFTTGTIGGRRVPCLAADVQLLYHSLYELRAPMKGDVSVLRDELGASNPWE